MDTKQGATATIEKLLWVSGLFMCILVLDGNRQYAI
jgi:hypothetical protein